MDNIVVRGVCSNSGFGVATQGLIKTIKAAGYNVKFIPISALAVQHRVGFSEQTINWLDSITITDKDFDPDTTIVIDVGSLIYALNVPKLNCKKSILYCTYETIKIHQNYVNMMNTKFDEIWTASNYNKASFTSSGVLKPVRVLPHYIDFSKLDSNAKPFKIKNIRSYNFIYNADLSYRKGLHYLIPAWYKEFKPDEDVSLTLKLTMGSMDKEARPKIVESINRLLFSRDLNNTPHAPILLFTEFFPYEQLSSFYKTGQCYISPNMGEGFALPIAESMACEVPIIASRCGAPIDYLSRQSCLFVDLDEKNPTIPITDSWQLRIDPHYEGQRLYNLSVDSLKQKLRYAFDHQDEMKEKGKKAKVEINEYCSLEKLSNKFKELIEK